MSLDLARTLVLSEVVPWGPVAQALFLSTTKGTAFVRALLDVDALTLERLEEELARVDVPLAETIVPDIALVERLPRGLCGRVFAIPVGKTDDGSVDLVMADARDAHAAQEVGHHLGVNVRIFRAPFAKVEEALSRLPHARRVDAVVESTLVSVRAPEGIPEPSSDRRVPPRAREPQPGQSGSPLPLVRRASDDAIPLVRRAEEQPVIELRAPYSRQSGRAYVESAAAVAMRATHTRDEILRLLLEGTSEYARRVVLFAVRKEAFTGLLCTPTMGDEARIRELKVGAEGQSVLANVANAGTYMGPLVHLEAHKPLLALLPAISDTVAVTAVRLRGRPLVLLLAEGMNNPAHDVRLIEELARAAGDAFARVLATKAE